MRNFAPSRASRMFEVPDRCRASIGSNATLYPALMNASVVVVGVENPFGSRCRNSRQARTARAAEPRRQVRDVPAGNSMLNGLAIDYRPAHPGPDVGLSRRPQRVPARVPPPAAERVLDPDDDDAGVHQGRVQRGVRADRCTATRRPSKIRLARDGAKFLIIILKIVTLFSPLRVFLPVSIASFRDRGHTRAGRSRRSSTSRTRRSCSSCSRSSCSSSASSRNRSPRCASKGVDSRAHAARSRSRATADPARGGVGVACGSSSVFSTGWTSR